MFVGTRVKKFFILPVEKTYFGVIQKVDEDECFVRWDEVDDDGNVVSEWYSKYELALE